MIQLKRTIHAIVLIFAFGLTTQVSTASPTHHIHAAPRAWQQIGKASWYGGKFQGHKTADGSRYDMYALTCAHRTLPLGSWVRVTNLRNDRSVILRVNDRGPQTPHLIADVSFAAAQKLGFRGVAKVRLEKVSPEDLVTDCSSLLNLVPGYPSRTFV
jgi:rare lipoprotein A